MLRRPIFSGHALRSARLRAGLTRAQLADRTGLAPLLLLAFERAQELPDATQLATLAVGLGCPMETFYRWQVDNE